MYCIQVERIKKKQDVFVKYYAPLLSFTDLTDPNFTEIGKNKV